MTDCPCTCHGTHSTPDPDGLGGTWCVHCHDAFPTCTLCGDEKADVGNPPMCMTCMTRDRTASGYPPISEDQRHQLRLLRTRPWSLSYREPVPAS